MSKLLSLLLSFTLFLSPALALEKPGEQLEEVGLDTELGAQVDLSLTFTDSTGKEAQLRDFTQNRRPIVIVPVYFSCPRLCGLLLAGVRDLLNEVDLELGKDYSILAVSFNEDDTPKKATARKVQYTKSFTGKGDPETGWSFLVGNDEQIDQLMNQIGFNYKPDGKEFAHTAAMILLTPNGQISQYFTGIDFSPWDTKLALVEASQGSIGSAIDHALLYCFRFDPTKGKYTWAAFGIMRAGGILTLVLLTGLIFMLRRRERMKSE